VRDGRVRNTSADTIARTRVVTGGLRSHVRFFRIDRVKALTSLSTEFRLRRADSFLTAGEHDAHTV
jgi:hypothetical protein